MQNSAEPRFEKLEFGNPDHHSVRNCPCDLMLRGTRQACSSIVAPGRSHCENAAAQGAKSIAALVGNAHDRIDDALGFMRVGIIEVTSKPRSDGIDEYRG